MKREQTPDNNCFDYIHHRMRNEAGSIDSSLVSFGLSVTLIQMLLIAMMLMFFIVIKIRVGITFR